MSQPPASFSGTQAYRSTGIGRTLLANAEQHQMLDGFYALADEDSSRGYYAKAITNAVDGLRGCASPVNSFMKDGNPSRRCIVFSGFEIEYQIGSYYGGPQTDVTIVDIRILQQGKNKVSRAALWEVNHTQGEWQIPRDPATAIDSTAKVSGKKGSPLKVGINGYCENINHAARMLPDHIARGKPTGVEALEDTGYKLFYVPQGSGPIKAGWNFLKDLGRTNPLELQSSRILAHYMEEAHKKNLYVEWTSHRGGSKVLTKAMKLLSEQNVDLGGRQSVFLSDHTSSHFEADVARRSVGMNTLDDQWHKSRSGIAQIVCGKRFGAAELACSINETLNHTKRENKAGKLATTGFSVGSMAYGAYEYGPKIAKLVSDLNISPSLANSIFTIIGWTAIAKGAEFALASVPSLNEGYHKGTKENLEIAINSASNKIFPPNK